MREVYGPHEIKARRPARCIQIDLDHAARPCYNPIERSCPSGARAISFRSAIPNTRRVHALAAAPEELRLHNAKVGGVMPLTLTYFR